MQLINQLLDFQKQEAGQFKLKKQNGDVVELLKDVVFSFTEYAHTRHVDLALNCDASISKIEFAFDRDELEKVFCNLLHNAFKFTPAGGMISITVGTTEGTASPSSSAVKIIVEDNGLGIPSDDLPRIFNRFFQVEQNYINESGFGIGLTL